MTRGHACCLWNVVNLERIPIKQMQVCNTHYHLLTHLLLFMFHARKLSVPLIICVCTFHLSLTHKVSVNLMCG